MNKDNDSSFFTQSGNFTSAVSGGVDPRTGLYNLNITLGHINGNNQQGPLLPVTLNYSPLSQGNNYGFGTGVSLGLSTFDTYSGRLSLSTGEQYQTDENTQSVTVKQKKLDSFKFEKNGNASYTVTHKTGDVEILRGESYGSYLKLPVRMMNAAGHTLYLETNADNRLATITDDTDTTLLQADYDDQVTLTFYPGTTESYQVVLKTNNDLLTTVTRRADGEDDLEWQIDYEDTGFWGQWVTALTSPSGMKDTVVYRHDGHTHRFPDSAPQALRDNPLPYVIQRTQNPGQRSGQPVQTSVFSYSDQNHLGYNSGVSWEATQDILYNCLDDYTYSSTETQGDVEAGISRKITRTYNSYHLQTREETTSGQNTVVKETRYYAEPGQGFDNQPAQFQLPKTVTTTWHDGATGQSRQEVVTTEFDTSGNPTSKIDADGTRSAWTYYSPDGESGCPADPYGFTRFIKTLTVTPRVSDYNDCPVHRTEYQYAVAPCTGSDIPTLVMKSQETQYADSTRLKSVAYSYGSGNLAGVMTQKQMTYYDDSARAYTTTEKVEYPDTRDADYPDALRTVYTLTSHDGLTVSGEKAVSRMTGRVLKKTNSQGVISTMTYSSLGLVTSRTHRKGTDYESTEVTEYSQDNGLFYATTTDSLGNKTRDTLDGMGRHIHTHINSVDTGEQDTWYAVHQQTGDILGRNLNATVNDYSGATRGTSPSQTLTQTLTYDDWGQVSKNTGSDGVSTETQTALVSDPGISRDNQAVWQTRAWQSGGADKTGITVTTLDSDHNPVKTEVQDRNGNTYSVVTRKYDGLKRLRSQTDELKQTTTYQYDLWGRPVSTRLADGTTTTKGYVAFCEASLPVSISVTGANGKTTLMGTQTFDGLGRLTQASNGGRTWTYQYDTASHRTPSRVSNPDGSTVQHTVIDALGEAPNTLTAGSITQSWTYNAITGALKEAIEGDRTLVYGYQPSGRGKMATMTHAGNGKSSTLLSYTVGGAPQSLQDYAGAQQTATFDIYGRVSTLSDSDGITCALSYDGLGRMNISKVTHPTGWTKTTTVAWDDFGREVSRTAESRNTAGQTTDTLTVTQVWNVKHQVTQRTTTQNGVTLRDEKYTYDPARNWLTEYDVSGTQLPVDETGNALRQQAFSYDAVTGNLTNKAAAYKEANLVMVAYQYTNSKDPCQLTGFKTQSVAGNTSTELKYDSAGRMTTDERGQTLTYDALGRLSTVKDSAGTLLCTYSYDAANRLSVQTAGGVSTRRYYAGSHLTCLDDGTNSTRLPGPHAQVSKGKNAGTWLTSTDMNGSVLSVSDGQTTERSAYSPFGTQNSQR